MKSWLKPGRLTLLKQGRGSEAGYTITESLIVLAVTATMFAAIVVAFSGRQSGVQFTKSVRDYESFLEGVITDVESGQYQSQGSCSVNLGASDAHPVINTGSPSDTGTNRDCVFLGKVMGIGDYSSGLPATIDPEYTSVFSLVGRRTVVDVGGGQRLTNSLFETKAVLSTDDGSGGGFSYPSESEYRHSYGLEVRAVKSLDNRAGQAYNRPPVNSQPAMTINIPPNSDVRGFGFVYNISGSSGGDGLARIYYYPEEIFATLGTDARIFDLQEASRGLKICLMGHNGQTAEIDVGTKSGQVNLTSVLDTKPQSGDLCYGV